MAGEEDFARYVEAVLPRLVEVGSTGAFLWCFADYAEELWDRPPCDPGGARHERHFGLVRPDGSLKPHAEVIRRFADNGPTIQPASKVVTLDVTPDEYYRDPWHHAPAAVPAVSVGTHNDIATQSPGGPRLLAVERSGDGAAAELLRDPAGSPPSEGEVARASIESAPRSVLVDTV